MSPACFPILRIRHLMKQCAPRSANALQMQSRKDSPSSRWASSEVTSSIIHLMWTYFYFLIPTHCRNADVMTPAKPRSASGAG